MVFDNWLEPTPRGGVYLFHVLLGRMIGFRREVIREPANWSSSRPGEDEARRAVAAFLKNSRIRRSRTVSIALLPWILRDMTGVRRVVG